MKLTALTQRRLVIAAALWAVFSITGFLVLPPIVKSQLEKRLSAELGRRVTVEKVRINPYTLAVTLENFSIRERDGATPFLGWRRLYVNFDALSSLGGEWVLSDIALDGFDVRVVLNADQSLNFSDIMAKLAPPSAAGPTTPAKPGRPVRIGRLQVSDARAEFSDLSRKRPFATRLGPLTFAITEFHTAGRRGAPYRFEAVTESAERFAWSGTIQADPVRSTGEFALENIVLAKYAPYYADRMQADLADGLLSVGGRYELSRAEGRPVLKLEDGTVRLRRFKLLERANQLAAVELASLDVTGIQADALAPKAAIGSVALAGGHIRVRREKDGSINLLTMLRPPAAVPAAASASAPPTATGLKPPEITVGELALQDFQVEVTDLAAPRTARLALNGLQFSLKNITLAEGASMPLQLAFNWAPRGTVRVNGQIGIAPVKADLKTEVAGLEILPLSPYLEQFINARLTQGSVTAALSVRAEQCGAKAPTAAVTGDLTVEKFGLVDGARSEALAGFDALTLRGLRATTAPELGVTLDEIAVAGPYARVIVNADQSVNLAAVFQTGAPAVTRNPAAPVASSAAAPAPRVEIGRVTITEGDFRFTDRSLEPNVTMAITHFGGTIAGLSSTHPAKAGVALTATADGSGPVAISGQLDPFGAKPHVDLKLDCRNVDLLPLSPYSGKFAGYQLARGQLQLDVGLLLDDRKIDAANVITLNQFTFGGAVKSPEATSLPVRLGVALLKDLDGKIVIDVPVQGSIDDPNFKVGRVVLRVVVNLLTKAAVSPFSLLGSMFGGGGDELAYQDFAPGSSELQPGEIKKLQTMTQALTHRPGLSLGLEGSYDAAADAYALKRLKLADRVRRAIWETKRRSDPNLAPPEQLVIAPEEAAVMIKQLFDEKFPPGTQFGTPLPPPPVVVAPPPPPPGLLKRLVAAITFQAARERRTARLENERHAAAYRQAVATAKAAGLPPEEMAGRLAETMAVTEDDLRALAAARAQRVRDYLLGVGQIGAERLFLAQNAEAVKESKGPRVFLSLQ